VVSEEAMGHVVVGSVVLILAGPAHGVQSG
jgi:hypothetical protein